VPDEAVAGAARRSSVWLVVLPAVSLLVVISMVLSTLHGISRIEAAVAEYHMEIGRLEGLGAGTRTAQVQFKTQVQEWKNILLRGHEPAQFEYFLGAFLARNDEIQEQLQELLQLARAARFPDDELVDLKVRHRELLIAYQEALKNFRADDPLSPRLVDALLRGLDRTLNTRFNRFAATVEGFEDASRAALADRLDRHFTTTRMAIWAHAGILSILLLLGIIFAAVERSTSKLPRSDG
jgi:methyl-accepting chemotaxis protein